MLDFKGTTATSLQGACRLHPACCAGAVRVTINATRPRAPLDIAIHIAVRRTMPFADSSGQLVQGRGLSSYAGECSLAYGKPIPCCSAHLDTAHTHLLRTAPPTMKPRAASCLQDACSTSPLSLTLSAPTYRVCNTRHWFAVAAPKARKRPERLT